MHYFTDQVWEVAHDSDGNVLAATKTQLFKLDGNGASVWTTMLAVTAIATGPSDSISSSSAPTSRSSTRAARCCGPRRST